MGSLSLSSAGGQLLTALTADMVRGVTVEAAVSYLRGPLGAPPAPAPAAAGATQAHSGSSGAGAGAGAGGEQAPRSLQRVVCVDLSDASPSLLPASPSHASASSAAAGGGLGTGAGGSVGPVVDKNALLVTPAAGSRMAYTLLLLLEQQVRACGSR